MQSRTILICLALFLGTVLLFNRAVNFDFLDYDDPDYVTQNSHVQSGLSRANIGWAFTTWHAGNWHPLTWLSHMLDWQFFGNDPRGHHATSIVLHALNAVLAFLALQRLTGSCWTNAAGAALFAWHPLRVESVAWISERKDVLSVSFGLLALWAYAVYAEKRRGNSTGATRFYLLALASFAAGLLCKPMLVTLPCLLLLLDGWPLGRFTICDLRFKAVRLAQEKIPFFLLSATSCVVTYFAQKNGGAVVENIAFASRLENAVMSFVGYLGKFFWPFDLAVSYPLPGHQSIATAIGAVLLIVAVTGVTFWQ